MSEQTGEQISGKSGTLGDGPAVPHSSDGQSEPVVLGAAGGARIDQRRIPALAPEQGAAAEMPEADAPKADMPKARRTPD